MTQSTINLARGIAYALNYHSIDAKLNTADWELAEMLAPFVAHGTECSKQGLDPAMTPNRFLPPSPEREPSDIEVIAERLAKVEDRLARLAVPADNFGSLLTRLDDIDARLDTQSELRIRSNGALDQRINAQNEARHNLEADLTRRIDKVVEIIGERVSGLVDRLDKLEKPWERQPIEVDPFPYPPGFPTGGADTAEAAAEAVLPVPQRGDRVRLEGAFGTMSGKRIKDGWYDVIGADSSEFQIKVPFDEHGSATPSWVPWLPVKSPFLKEVHTHGTR